MSNTRERQARRTASGRLFDLQALLRWWYGLTTPASLEGQTALAQRETARRARLLSTLVLLSLVVLLAVLLGAVLDYNGILLLVISIALLLQGPVVVLNRAGKVLLAGLFITIWLDVGLSLFLFTLPGGLRIANLPDLYLLIEPELFAAALLPAWSVFVVAGYNSLLILAVLTIQPHSAELNQLLAASGYEVIGRPILLQLIVAVICYLWARGMLQALARADRAEEIAQLERTLAQHNQRRLEALQAERQATLAYEHQREINEIKDQFLLNVSHELRTPLTTLGGTLELLQEIDEHQDTMWRTDLLTLAVENHEELVSMVSGILDATSVISEIPQAQPEAICLQKLVQEELEALSQEDVLAYTIHVQVSKEILVWADPQFLRQVLRNLLTNIFKYVPKQTEIHIQAVQAALSSPVCLSIQDAGPGIPTEELPLLFEKFVRLKRDLAGTVRGTGLGLYICKRLVEAMEGRIWVESSGRVGEGSRFCINLPPFSPPSLP